MHGKIKVNMYLLQNIHCHQNSLEIDKFKPFQSGFFFLKSYELGISILYDKI